MNHDALKPGDILHIVQKDGHRIILLVYEDGVGVKADCPGTKLQVKRDSSFFVKAVAVKHGVEETADVADFDQLAMHAFRPGAD